MEPTLKHVSITLDQDMYDELREEAAHSQRPLSRYIRHALKLHLYMLHWLRH